MSEDYGHVKPFDMPGFWELIVLLIILVIVFGARRLPALGEAVGRTIVNFREAKNQAAIEVSRDDSPPKSIESKPGDDQPGSGQS